MDTKNQVLKMISWNKSRFYTPPELTGASAPLHWQESAEVAEVSGGLMRYPLCLSLLDPSSQDSTTNRWEEIDALEVNLKIIADDINWMFAWRVMIRSTKKQPAVIPSLRSKESMEQFGKRLFFLRNPFTDSWIQTWAEQNLKKGSSFYRETN